MRIKVTRLMGFTDSPESADGCWRRSHYIDGPFADRAHAQRVADWAEAGEGGAVVAEIIEGDRA